MTEVKTADFDPTLDLKLERVVPVSPELVWTAWTQPEHLVHWFTPKPWKTTACDIDLRPGGIFRAVMQSPDGEVVDDPGCFLVVDHGRKLVFTDALLPGFRPKETSFMTAIVLIEKHPDGTKYTAIAKHKNETDRQAHVDMGFHDGWSAALDQLVEYVQSI